MSEWDGWLARSLVDDVFVGNRAVVSVCVRSSSGLSLYARSDELLLKRRLSVLTTAYVCVPLCLCVCVCVYVRTLQSMRERWCTEPKQRQQRIAIRTEEQRVQFSV